MVYAVATVGDKKHKVAGLDMMSADFFAKFSLFGRIAWQLATDAFENEFHHAAAIRRHTLVLTAEFIRCSHPGESFLNYNFFMVFKTFLGFKCSLFVMAGAFGNSLAPFGGASLRRTSGSCQCQDCQKNIDREISGVYLQRKRT